MHHASATENSIVEQWSKNCNFARNVAFFFQGNQRNDTFGYSSHFSSFPFIPEIRIKRFSNFQSKILRIYKILLYIIFSNITVNYSAIVCRIVKNLRMQKMWQSLLEKLAYAMVIWPLGSKRIFCKFSRYELSEVKSYVSLTLIDIMCIMPYV